MRHKTVVMILESLDANYRQKMSKKEMALQLRNWSAILKEVPDEQGLKGLQKMLEDPDGFMPTVGKFKSICVGGEGCQSLEDEALVAWDMARKNLDAYSSPVFKDTCIAEAIRKMGGWKKLCSMLETEEPFRKKEFIDLYVIVKRAGHTYPPMLRGKYKDDFKFIGYAPEDDLKQVVVQIERKQNSDARLMQMITKGVASEIH